MNTLESYCSLLQRRRCSLCGAASAHIYLHTHHSNAVRALNAPRLTDCQSGYSRSEQRAEPENSEKVQGNTVNAVNWCAPAVVR